MDHYIVVEDDESEPIYQVVILRDDQIDLIAQRVVELLRSDE